MRLGSRSASWNRPPFEGRIEDEGWRLRKDGSRFWANVVRVLGHRETLASVAQYLVSNAIKFVAAGTTPHVRVWTARSGGRTRFNVRDNGIGVPPADQARIFSPFERLHGHSVYAGTGLGLAIVAEAIRRLGGTFGVESDGRSGSCFWVELANAPDEGSVDGGANSAR